MNILLTLVMPVRIIAHLAMIPTFRGMAQFGSAPALGAGGRGFESLCPDQKVILEWLSVSKNLASDGKLL